MDRGKPVQTDFISLTLSGHNPEGQPVTVSSKVAYDLSDPLDILNMSFDLQAVSVFFLVLCPNTPEQAIL